MPAALSAAVFPEPPVDARALVGPIRDASRKLVREFGFMGGTLAGTDLPPSAVHTLVEIGRRGPLTGGELCGLLLLEKSSVSRMLRKLIDGGELAEIPSATDGRSKLLTLTPEGQDTLARIEAFAEDQVLSALARLPPAASGTIRAGLSSYANALEAARTGGPVVATADIVIHCGYRPGVIGRVAEMHGRHYATHYGFGAYFERKVAAEMAEFAGRLDNPANGLWVAERDGAILGTIAIDGEDLPDNKAHLRWFHVQDGLRGSGIGRRLIAAALDFCDARGFAETHLWTLKGLDAARKLYDALGFVLAEEFSGDQWGCEVVEHHMVRAIPAAKSVPSFSG